MARDTLERIRASFMRWHWALEDGESHNNLQETTKIVRFGTAETREEISRHRMTEAASQAIERRQARYWERTTRS